MVEEEDLDRAARVGIRDLGRHRARGNRSRHTIGRQMAGRLSPTGGQAGPDGYRHRVAAQWMGATSMRMGDSARQGTRITPHRMPAASYGRKKECRWFLRKARFYASGY